MVSRKGAKALRCKKIKDQMNPHAKAQRR